MKAHHSRLFARIALSWLPIAALSATVALSAYVAVALSYRGSVDDLQVAMARTAAATLGRGAVPETVLPVGDIRIGESLAAYMVIYDGQGIPLVGNGYLYGVLPKLPPEMFSEAARLGEHRVTWQPAPGLRQALVIVPYGDGPAGYAASGRSLSEVERQERLLTLLIVAAFAASLFMTLLLVVVRERYTP